MEINNKEAALLKERFNASGDFRIRHLAKDQWTLQYYYLSSLCDDNLLHSMIEKPFLASRTPEDFTVSLLAFGAVKQTADSKLHDRVTDGNAVIQHMGCVYSINVKKSLNDQSEDVKIEHALMGPQKALSEDLSANVNMIRSRYKKQELHLEQYVLGRSSRTDVALLYDARLAKKDILDRVKAKLLSIDVDVLQSTGQLEILMNNRRLSLFPTMIITERPDRIVLNISQGKIVILLQGSPFALVLPAIFFDFMSAMDDLYQAYWISRGLIVIRYIALAIALTLPALYISLISYNPEVTRVQLTMSIAGSRAAVPYPSYFEVIFMLFLIEALVEASLRLPKFIGSTATTVGGLILGQAAQQAGLVSSIMIIITSAVAISNFVIPINTMSAAMRFVKYPLIILAILFGFIGTIAGMFFLIGYLANIRSFGEPYLKLFIGEHRSSRPDKSR
ncbi:spore germination protein [Paenibacillus sp. MBLB2552]|uniref:Spore germination protein n=1 Tax=Paenibacillus mellifer TaxID=2937794 RepID=A0A9X1XXF6_9BACL|nr:spore germination protein [Paenibacillus mellifer]MCK8487032.1 spore germination protein [Paenibacillus mellifer]